MAYYQDFESEEEDPNPFDTMSDTDDDTLQRLGLYKPLGYRFLARLTGLTELALRQSFTTTLVSPEKTSYTDIDTYFTNGQCHTFKLRMTKLFRVRRFEDVNCFFGDSTQNRKLLWHGTRSENITSILTLGFTRPAPHGQLFGNGIYFADRVSKSAQYCDGMGGTPAKGTKGHLFLCSVTLGKSFTSQKPLNNYVAPPEGYESIIGAGQYTPDEKESRSYYDAEIPCGKTINRPLTMPSPYYGSSISRVSGSTTHMLRFNEYVVYDVDRITIKFLVEFEVI